MDTSLPKYRYILLDSRRILLEKLGQLIERNVLVALADPGVHHEILSYSLSSWTPSHNPSHPPK